MRTVAAASLFFLYISVCSASEKSHGLALYGSQDLKYKPGQPYDFVNLNAPKTGILNLDSFGSFTKLNPFSLKGKAAPRATLCFQTLGQQSLDPKEPFSVYGQLAEAFELADDELSLTCYLNPAAYFSDGVPVKADDVIFSFNLIFDQEFDPFYRSYFSDVEKAEKVDDLTVVFRFKKKNKELPLTLVSSLRILPRHVYGIAGKNFGKDFDETLPIGSGPYKVKDYDKGAFISYDYDSNWWGKDLSLNRGRFNFDVIKALVFLDPFPALQALKSGMIDVKTIYSSKDWHLEFNGDYFKKGYCVRKRLTPVESVSGMQGFAMNLRKPIFQDIRVRKALASVFDFDHMNQNLFYGQYTRCTSYWNGSNEMTTQGPAAGRERALLVALAKTHNKPAKGIIQVPKDAVLRGPYVVGAKVNGEMVSIYDRVIAANTYLDQIGWKYDPSVNARRKGEHVLSVEFLLYGPGFQRICNPYIELLREIGVKARIQIVQPAEYIKRVKSFDYDIITWNYSVTNSPGNELRDRFHSSSATVSGSENVCGITNPAIDEVIEIIAGAQSRQELVLHTKLLDRILSANHYMIPQWYISDTRAIYWNKFKGPDVFTGKGQYVTSGIFESEVINFWWYDAERSKTLKAAMDTNKPFGSN